MRPLNSVERRPTSLTPAMRCTRPSGRTSCSCPPASGATTKRPESSPVMVPVWLPSKATRAPCNRPALEALPAPAAAPPPWLPSPVPAGCLQMGQAAERRSHSSMHWRWKRWSQPSCRRLSPSANSARQTMHCCCVSPARSALRHTTARPQLLISELARPWPRLRTSCTSARRPCTASSLAMVFNSSICSPRGNRMISSRCSGSMRSQIVGRRASPSANTRVWLLTRARTP
mmetsp:Transcript_90347/g.292437  ORF Transcript_90347/g.292437 Transcript_90347/m.292437 type:complete len:231 (-) Transcript_90347:851-1543(-)